MATITASKWGVTIGGGAPTHDAARDATSASSVLVNPTTNNGRDIEYYSYTGGKGNVWEISRTFLYFDTSSVTALDNLVLKIDGVTNASNVKVMKATAFGGDGSNNLITADHNNVTWATSYDNSGTLGETWSTGSTVSITLRGSSGQAETDMANNDYLILAIVSLTDYLDFSVLGTDTTSGVDWATTTPYLDFDDLTPSYEISNVFTKSTSSISTIIGKSLASISKFYDVSLVDTGGSPPPSGTATTYVSADFSDQTYTNTTTLPTGWREMTTSDTVWDSQLQTLTLAGDWKFDYNNTASGSTGPNGGLAGGVSATTGTQSNTNRYLYIETSAGHSGPPYSMSVITLPSLDFTNSLSNSTLKLTFWFHMYGTNNNNTQHFGVAATTSQTDASSASEVVTGSGFTSENGGGLDITYWTNDTGTTTSTSNRISGQQQTSSGALWRKAEVDLNDLAGEATVYLHFMISNVRYFTCDFAVDGVLIEGEE
jgi:hypothetical protein